MSGGRRVAQALVVAAIAVLLVSIPTLEVLAQSGSQLAPGAPSWCAYCTPPGVIPPVDPPPGPVDPGDPGDPGDGDPPPPPSGSRGWGALGAAGLALAAGIPLGSALQPTMPFRPVIAEAGAPGAVPQEVAPDPGPIAVQAAPGVLVPEEVDPAAVEPTVQQEAAGVLAPDTASHLPLLLAIGIASIAGGVALMRDQRRRRRRARVRS